MSKSDSANIKKTPSRWRVQKRIFYVSELNIDAAKINIKPSLEKLWDSGASAVIVQVLDNKNISHAVVEKSADIDSCIALKLSLGREEIRSIDSFKAQLRELLQVYKPTLLVCDLKGARGSTVLDLAAEIGIPIASALAVDSSAYNYLENAAHKFNRFEFFPRKSEKSN